MKMEKKAIHFGIQNSNSDTTFDGEKDAEYFHLLLKQRGYDSSLKMSSESPITGADIKKSIQQLKESSTTHGRYFISISGASCYNKSRFKIFAKGKRKKAMLLSNDDAFTKEDIVECLSYFDASDKVFFLMSDCEVKKCNPKLFKANGLKEKLAPNTSAAILSLGLNQRAMKHLNISSGAVDFEYAIKTSKTLEELIDNLNDLNAMNISYVNSDLGCYNLDYKSALEI